MPSKEQAKYTFTKELGGLPLLNANFKNQNFARHVHEGYCIGVIDKGAQQFFRSGANHIASRDCIILVNPDQVHDGHSATDYGWSYRAIYPLESMLESVLQEFVGSNKGTALFKEPVVSDRQTANLLRQLYTDLETCEDPIKKEALYFHAMASLLQRHAKPYNQLKELGAEHKAVKQVKEYLDANVSEKVSTQELANLVQLNPFYLTRVFQKHVGLPPHAYQTQGRVNMAKKMLADGFKATHVGLAVGFSDQSHFNRHFNRCMGITPGRYQKALKD